MRNNRRRQSGFSGFRGAFLAICVIAVLGIAGYGKNVYKLFQCSFEAPYKCEFVRTVGLVPIVGAITGWINFEFDGE